MSAIPLHNLDEVATKRDLAVLRAELSAELTTEIGKLRKTVTNWMLTLLVAVVGAMAGVSFTS